jgi:hypothetical protein
MRVGAACSLSFVFGIAGQLAAPGHACARHVRPLFEPTDLEIEQPGVIEGDLQFGLVRGDGALRVVVPDFELDVGILPNLEFDLDGAYAIESRSRGPFSFDHAAPDSLWPAAKLGFYDAQNEVEQSAFAFGVQLGPKLPVAAAAHGVGAEGLALLGTSYAGVHAVWNAGGFADPAPDASSSQRPHGLEFGVDLNVDLDADQRFSLNGSVSLVHFLSSDPDQLLMAAGVTWSISEMLDVSLTGLLGVLAGGDRYGILLGVSPKFALFD